MVHFLRRYAASWPSLHAAAGGLTPYKLQRTIAYIKAHLEQELSLATLAAVAQMSPTHFAHLFKDATGLTPHQYVILCRMEHAKRLLAETDMPLIEIGPQVGCMDQSHFTALFRTHVSMTPKAYRNTTRRDVLVGAPRSVPALRSEAPPPARLLHPRPRDPRGPPRSRRPVPDCGARHACGASALLPRTICARLQHFSQACHRWRGTPAL